MSPPRQRWTEEELIEDLQRVADIVDQSPTMDEYSEHGVISADALRQRFGSWAEAHRAADLEPRDGPLNTDGRKPKFADLSLEDVGLTPLGERPGGERA